MKKNKFKEIEIELLPKKDHKKKIKKVGKKKFD